MAASRQADKAAALGVAYQIPRNSLALLMIAQAVVVLPHAAQLSPWVIAVGLFCGYWRMRVYQGRWDYPQRWVKAVLVLGSVAGVIGSGISAISLEAATSLLILGLALKLIEMKSRRDAYLVIFLSYFVIATEFLFDQAMSVAVYEIGATIVVTAAMVGMNQLHTRVRPLVSLRLAASLVLQALPLTIVLFLFFPRIAPLWTIPLPGGAVTGISDRMTPGDVANLARSDELAFRVVFDEGIPQSRDLYFRGLVYSEFEDGTWSMSRTYPQRRNLLAASAGLDGVGYEILLQPTMSDWLFALDTAVPASSTVAITSNYRLVAPDPVMSVYRYEVTSYPALPMDPELSNRGRAWELRLPDQGNPRVRAFARQLFDASGSVGAFADAVLQHIRNEPYSYTLQPERVTGRDSIDDFWFETREGFCTHFAGAFVFLMRAAGVPARMVGGYQGGEVNTITGHLMVRQYDAHAWTEIWIDGSGWQRVDPTSAVAPGRIEMGIEAALSASDRAVLSAFTNARLGDWAVLADLLQWTDSFEHRWNLWVIGYDAGIQKNVLTDLLGEVTPTRIGFAMLVAGGLSLGVVAFTLFWRRRPVKRHPVERAFARFSDNVAEYGYKRRPDESPSAFLSRVAVEANINPAQVQLIVAQLEAVLYNPSIVWGQREVRYLRAQLRRLQFRLAFGSAR